MNTTLIIIQTVAFLAAMGVVTGHALRLSRRNMRLTLERNEWRDHARMLAKRATRAEATLEQLSCRLEDVTDERNEAWADLSKTRRNRQAVLAREETL
jgi:hypothetical protein